MKKMICIGLLILGVLQVTAQETDLRALQQLNAKFIHNFVTNDTAAHNRILHKEFVRISSEGQSAGRKEYLDDWAHGFDGFVYWDYRNEDIKIFGSTALVHSQNKYVVVKEGKEITGMAMSPIRILKKMESGNVCRRKFLEYRRHILPGMKRLCGNTISGKK